MCKFEERLNCGIRCATVGAATGTTIGKSLVGGVCAIESPTLGPVGVFVRTPMTAEAGGQILGGICAVVCFVGGFLIN